MKIDQAEILKGEKNILIETFIRRRMKAGDAGLRKKAGESRRWFDDSECRTVHNRVLKEYDKLKSEIQNTNDAIKKITHGPDLRDKIPVKLNENFLCGAIHRHCLELIRKKENLEKEKNYPAPKLDMKKDLVILLKENGGEKFIIDWIFRNRQDAKDKRHKNLLGLNYVAKKSPGLPTAVHEDMYGEEILQLIEALRKRGNGQWRGKYGVASVIDYLKRALAGIYADAIERKYNDLDYRKFDWSQPGPGNAESKIMAGPGSPIKGERKGDPGRAGFWTKRKGLDIREVGGSEPDEQERIAREAFRKNHPDHFSETVNRSVGPETITRSDGPGVPREDHWLDYYQADHLFGGEPALAIEDEKFAEWQQSTYWQFPEQVCERIDLYNKAFDSSEYDPEKSYQENLRQAKRKKTLRYIGILAQKFGEDWDDKEIAEFWFWPPHRTSQIKGIIRSQKKLVRKDLERLGYIRPPIIFRFPDRSGKLLYDPIKQKEILETGFPRKKSGIYLRHLDLLNKVIRLKKKHVSKYKICVKCGVREQRRKTRIINGLRYCLTCWKRLKI